MTFVDLTKAFDTVSRHRLWKIMAKFGCPPRFIAMVRQFHDVMQARVQNDGEFSELFEETNGVKPGCVIAPTLFSMMFSAMPWMLFRTVTLVFLSGTVLMAIYSTLEGCKPKLRCRLMCQMSSSVQIIWIRMPAQRQKCKERHVSSLTVM